MNLQGEAWPALAGRIDWSTPWFAPYRRLGEPLAKAVVSGAPLHDALNEAAVLAADLADAAAPAPRSVSFVPQSGLPAGQAYEAFVFATGRCPVREGLHDFFNGLCWLHLPATKRAFNRLQAGCIAEAGIGATRGPLRDALTLFDENGALLDAPAPLWEALLAHDWQRLFVTLRPLWREARLLVLGHAALEKLVFPRKAITVHVYRAPFAIDSVATLDAELAAGLRPGALAAKPFVPLPVLGLPGWDAENAELCFYDDLTVFRPRRAAPERSTTKALHANGTAGERLEFARSNPHVRARVNPRTLSENP